MITMKQKSKKLPPKPQMLRPMNEHDRSLALSLEKERTHIRRQLYLKNQLVVIGVIVAFLAYQLLRSHVAGLILGIFMLLAACSTFAAYFIQDHEIRKALSGKEELLCANATAYLSTDSPKPSILFKSKDGKLLFTSSLKDDLFWFSSGGQALLVYYNHSAPIVYKIS